MEIGRADADARSDQHLGGLDRCSLDRDPALNRADTGEHLAADLPGIMAAAPGVGNFGPRKTGAEGIDEIAAHS